MFYNDHEPLHFHAEYQASEESLISTGT
ncbi:MAG: DUF4160 domain-containing protein [Acidobacteriota bacterium]